MPGNELKRKLSQLPDLFKSLPGNAEGVLRSPRWHRRAASSLELTLSDFAIVKAGSLPALVAGPENSPPSPGRPKGKIRRLYVSIYRCRNAVTPATGAVCHSFGEGKAMRELAVQRTVAVGDYLAVSGIAPGRRFLGAPKSVPAGAKWTPRTELNLAMP